MNCFWVVGIRIDHRHANATSLQRQLTKYGCQIKLRVGLHETNETSCSDDGIILLAACGPKDMVEAMICAFNSIDGVRAKSMLLE